MEDKRLVENPYFDWEKTVREFDKYTNYNLSFFHDRAVEAPWRFLVHDRGTVTGADGKKTPCKQLEHYEGEVIEEGTPISEKYLGNMDIAIGVLFAWRKWVDSQLLALKLKGDATDASLLNGYVAIQFYSTFFMHDLRGKTTILDGYYDEAKGELSV